MKIEIHQALFGYADGHTLLSSSINLPISALRLLSSLTDLSGPVGKQEFENSYTGLPLGNTEYYALFRTWIADEMPRPGCVWSHVLLIRLVDLAQIHDTAILRKAFCRPTLGRYAQYETSVELQVLNRNNLLQLNFPIDVSIIFKALYTDARHPVLLKAVTSEQYEALVFSIWSQQWPRLRRNFRFSTGSLSDRSSLGPTFDLQIVPFSFRPIKSSAEVTPILLGGEDSSLFGVTEDWLSEALRDLVTPGNLRLFFREFGADVSYPRGAFRPLASAFCRQIDKTNSEVALSDVATSFPEPNDAIHFKESILGQLEIEESIKFLKFCLFHREGDAFSESLVTSAFYLGRIWRERQAEFLDIVSQVPDGDMTTGGRVNTMLEILSSQIMPTDFPNLWKAIPKRAGQVVESCPDLALDERSWRLSDRNQELLLDALMRKEHGSAFYSGVLKAALSGGAAHVADNLVKLAGESALPTFHAWFDQMQQLPQWEWRLALSEKAKSELAADGHKPGDLALLIWLAPTSKVSDLNPQRRDIQNLAQQSLDRLPQCLQIPTAFFLTSMGLSGHADSGFHCLRRGLFTTYHSLSRMEFLWESWAVLDPKLPTLMPWNEWDKCKKLRKGVREWLARNSQLRNQFSALPVTEVEAQIVRSILKL